MEDQMRRTPRNRRQLENVQALAGLRARFIIVPSARRCRKNIATSSWLPPFTAISTLSKSERIQRRIDAQNVLTGEGRRLHGEVPRPCLHEAGCRSVIIGNSERRQLFTKR